jgi:hypothetical protein
MSFSKIDWTARHATASTASWPSRRPPSLAQQAAYAALRAAARRSAAEETKLGAHHFALCPAMLDDIEVGLSRLTPRAMTRRLKHLFAEEVAMPSRGCWVGGLAPAIHLKSALTYARYTALVERSHLARPI